MIRIECIRDTQNFLTLEAEWFELLETIQNDNIFLTFEWISTWWKYCAGHHDELFIIIARDDDDKLIGIAPLFKTQTALFKALKLEQLCFLGNRDSDYLNFIVRADYKDEFFSLVFTHLFQNSSWDVVELRDIPENGRDILVYLKKHTRKVVSFVRTVCPYARLPATWEIYLNGLRATKKMNMKAYFERRKRFY